MHNGTSHRSNRLYIVNMMRSCHQRKYLRQVNGYAAFVFSALVSPDTGSVGTNELLQHLISRENSILGSHLRCKICNSHPLADAERSNSLSMKFYRHVIGAVRAQHPYDPQRQVLCSDTRTQPAGQLNSH